MAAVTPTTTPSTWSDEELAEVRGRLQEEIDALEADLVAQNERAIARIDAGTYGVCESCHKPIGKERLQAFPRATLCVACKQKEERR
jgi:DnaK suppressor protein